MHVALVISPATPQFNLAKSLLQAAAEIVALVAVRVLREDGPRLSVIGDVAGKGDRQLESTLELADGQPDMNPLVAVVQAHKADQVSLGLAPGHPVRDAAHANAEVPAIADERDAEVHGQAAAVVRL